MRALVLALLLPAAAQADCAHETFVSCETGGGKRLEVCVLSGAGFTYTFGPPGAPEMALTVPMAAGPVQPWPGVGRAIWSSVAFANGDTVYEVWHSIDRLTEDAAMAAGVTVLQGGRVLARLDCRPGGIIAPAFTLEDRMEEAGLCRDPAGLHWQSC